MADFSEPDRRAGGRHAAASSWDALVRRTRGTLRATAVLAEALEDRIAYLCATDVTQLDTLPADDLGQLVAVSDTFQDGACRALFLIEPELGRNARVIARLARDGVSAR